MHVLAYAIPVFLALAVVERWRRRAEASLARSSRSESVADAATWGLIAWRESLPAAGAGALVAFVLLSLGGIARAFDGRAPRVRTGATAAGVGAAVALALVAVVSTGCAAPPAVPELPPAPSGRVLEDAAVDLGHGLEVGQRFAFDVRSGGREERFAGGTIFRGTYEVIEADAGKVRAIRIVFDATSHFFASSTGRFHVPSYAGRTVTARVVGPADEVVVDAPSPFVAGERPALLGLTKQLLGFPAPFVPAPRRAVRAGDTWENPSGPHERVVCRLVAVREADGPGKLAELEVAIADRSPGRTGELRGVVLCDVETGFPLSIELAGAARPASPPGSAPTELQVRFRGHRLPPSGGR